ncbi:hypothetical protein P2G88_03885 [Aliiglaciecola sp. CAU 1673]|uniref:hypothetical protein n=1 Tax=Aliiglaciecola sp. CAU 1673 TaxID=3032595 RepID=UPI0023DA4FDA|nr:hypothetical protein [Aliiglaciecola sp. CAU 1673]MDF2177384.1 hypothetical protein [Aliiglaciecola sp. CAU 1673]
MNHARLYCALLLMLLHSFFACAGAPFHLPDADHQDFAHLSHMEGPHLHETQSDREGGTTEAHEHQLHVHLSCLNGYSFDLCLAPALPEKAVRTPNVYLNLYYQPPVPPPNSLA